MSVHDVLCIWCSYREESDKIIAINFLKHIRLCKSLQTRLIIPATSFRGAMKSYQVECLAQPCPDIGILHHHRNLILVVLGVLARLPENEVLFLFSLVFSGHFQLSMFNSLQCPEHKLLSMCLKPAVQHFLCGSTRQIFPRLILTETTLSIKLRMI